MQTDISLSIANIGMELCPISPAECELCGNRPYTRT